MGFKHNIHIRNRHACKDIHVTMYNDYKWIQDYVFKTCHSEELWNMLHDIIAMNLLKVFNINIFEMINTFMNTRFIFKLTHSMYFIDPNDKVYTFMCPQKLKVVDSHHAWRFWSIFEQLFKANVYHV